MGVDPLCRRGVAPRQRSAFDRLDFQYSTDATSLTTGSWTNVQSLGFTSPVLMAGRAPDGNSFLCCRRLVDSRFDTTIPAGGEFWIRWVDITGPAGTTV